MISNKSPFDGLHMEEILELILTIASLEHKVSILFLGNASTVLTINQELPDRTNLSQTIAAFNLFELEKIYLEKKFFSKLQKWRIPMHHHNIDFFNWKQFDVLCKQYDQILIY